MNNDVVMYMDNCGINYDKMKEDFEFTEDCVSSVSVVLALYELYNLCYTSLVQRNPDGTVGGTKVKPEEIEEKATSILENEPENVLRNIVDSLKSIQSEVDKQNDLKVIQNVLRDTLEGKRSTESTIRALLNREVGKLVDKVVGQYTDTLVFQESLTGIFIAIGKDPDFPFEYNVRFRYDHLCNDNYREVVYKELNDLMRCLEVKSKHEYFRDITTGEEKGESEEEKGESEEEKGESEEEKITCTSELMRYVPKNKKSAIKDMYKDDDGYWMMLKEGWHASRTDKGCRTIHEDTITDLRYQIAGVERYEG